MTRPIFRLNKMVSVLPVCLLLMGCTAPLWQQSQTVKTAPISEKYKLTGGLKGRVAVFLAEASTGQEQYKYPASSSLSRVMLQGRQNFGFLSFLDLGNKSKAENDSLSQRNLEVLSFSDLANQLNEKGLSQKYSRMMSFYKRNGIFQRQDLECLAKEIELDYFILPRVLDVRRWGANRFSVLGVKIINTQVVYAVVAMEIWDRDGYNVFGATSDVTIASEKIQEAPISFEKAFETAWSAIIEQL